MTLNDFRGRIEAGGAAARVDAWDSALVFKIGSAYYVGGLNSVTAAECSSWEEVLTELGDWALYGGWQPYRLAAAVEVVR